MDSFLVKLLLGLIAIEHFGFMVLEAFLWQKPIGLKIFRMTPEVAEKSAKLAMNQGLYNGFLAAGIVWSLITGKSDIAIFFSACVAIAGMVGAITVSRRIFLVQAVPAICALLALLLL
jgi:putative membrane protein